MRTGTQNVLYPTSFGKPTLARPPLPSAPYTLESDHPLERDHLPQQPELALAGAGRLGHAYGLSEPLSWQGSDRGGSTSGGWESSSPACLWPDRPPHRPAWACPD